ncbi:hypothetical protein [Myroides odoratus]|uniref:hypothetical protein n=1 Tax=Myroides odoratus TaxID=256 RepID=UPI00333FAE91
MKLTVTPMLAYEDFKMYYRTDLIHHLGIAFNLFFKKSQLLNTLSVTVIKDYVLQSNDPDKMEVLVVCQLIYDDSDLQVIKVQKSKEFVHITEQLEQAEQTISFIRTPSVKEAFIQAKEHNERRQKQLNTELTILRRILEIITLLKPNQHHAD